MAPTKEQPKLVFCPPSVTYLTSALGPQNSRFLTETITQGPEALRANQLRVHRTAVCTDKAAQRRHAACGAIPHVHSAPRAWQGGSLLGPDGRGPC